MSHTLEQPQAASPKRAKEFVSSFSGHNVNFFKLIHSEIIKLFSLASTYWLLGIAFALQVGIGLLLAALSNSFASDSETGALIAKEAAKATTSAGLFFAVLIFLSFGVVTIAGEYGTGMIRTTMTAAPRRYPALIAKTLVVVLTSSLVVLVGNFLTYGLNRLILKEELRFDLTGDLLRAVFMSTLYVALGIVMAVGVGMLLRATAGGIVTIVGIFFVLSTVFQILTMTQQEWVYHVMQFLPSELGGRMQATGSEAANQAAQGQGNASVNGKVTPLDWNVAAAWLAVEAFAVWFLGLFVAQKRDV